MKKENIFYAFAALCFLGNIIFSSEKVQLCPHEKEQKIITVTFYDTQIEAIEELKSYYRGELKGIEIKTFIREDLEIKAFPILVTLTLDKNSSKAFFVIYSNETKKYTFI